MHVYPCVRNFSPWQQWLVVSRNQQMLSQKTIFIHWAFSVQQVVLRPTVTVTSLMSQFCCWGSKLCLFLSHFKSQIFKALWYKDGYCFNHWIEEKKKTGLNIVATKQISAMKSPKNRSFLQITSTCMKCVVNMYTQIIFLHRL